MDGGDCISVSNKESKIRAGSSAKSCAKPKQEWKMSALASGHRVGVLMRTGCKIVGTMTSWNAMQHPAFLGKCAGRCLVVRARTNVPTCACVPTQLTNPQTKKCLSKVNYCCRRITARMRSNSRYRSNGRRTGHGSNCNKNLSWKY